MSELAVVVLNYNGAHHLRRFLPLIIQHTPAELGEVYVVDNASVDESCSVALRYVDQAHLLRLSHNKGYAGGYNDALRQIQRPYYVLLNNDVAPTQGWLLPLLRSLQTKEIAACQPKMRSFRNKNQFDYGGAAGGYIDCLGYTFCRGRIWNTVEEDHGQYDTSQSIFWASGACFGVCADAYWQIGGLDEDFFMHMEEVDLCWRLQRAGFQIQYCPNSIVFHWGAGTLQHASALKTYYNFRNNWFMLMKNLPLIQLLWIFPFRMLLDLCALLYFLLQAQWTKAKGLTHAYLYCIAHPWKGMQLRKRASGLKQKTNKPLLARCCLVAEYFFLKRTTYSAIFFRKS